jgi:23S rRNA (cytidine1920-2'-O)/16S rRNA (cytidine1409-2'-O)-methyltransferase
MRLDLLLVKKGYFSSRNRAINAIRRGLVTVNGRTVRKPSEDVEFSAYIEIREEERPEGYWKLRELNEEWRFLKRGLKVLDLGSSAGGFLEYSSEFADLVVGIELSKEFKRELSSIERKENVVVIFGDVFKINLNSLRMYGKFDLLLNDLTLKPSDSYLAMKRFFPLINSGKALFVAKTGIDSTIPEIEFEIINRKVSENKREEYILLKIELE